MQLIFERTKHLTETGNHESWLITGPSYDGTQNIIFFLPDVRTLLYILKIPNIKSVKIFPVHAMEAKRWNGGIEPLILYFHA